MDPQTRLEAIYQQLQALCREVEQLRSQFDAAPAPRPDEPPAVPALAALASFLSLSPAIEEDELLGTILRCAMHATGARGAGLTLYDRHKQRLVFRAAIGDGAEGVVGYEIPLEGSLHGLAFATGEIQAATPLHTDIEKSAGTRFRSVLVAPLLAEGEAIGTLSAVNKEHADTFTAQDMEAYQLFSDLAALVLRQRLRERLVKQRLEGSPVQLPDALEALSAGERERQLMRLADKITDLGQRRPEAVDRVLQILAALE